MKLRTKLTSLVAAVALSAVIAGPAMGAAPTYSGQIYCTRVPELGGGLEPLDTVTSWPKKQINQQLRFWEGTGDYVKKSCYADVTKDA